ncbi:MAG: MBL fold metallo-hydrolase [Paludibacteraceae bacterium]|nr:MBL fold metallo-hydrolase [Paludibacteraceae bacterium]
MKMKVTRTLHSIGQGAFYTEKFEYEGQQCNVVFDCGGTSSVIKGRVKKYCSDKGAEKPTIDAVFISHFDNDHVNGLETLFRHAEVKRIFLPLLDDDEVYALSLSFVEKLGEPIYRGLVDSAVNGEPLKVGNEMPEIDVVRIDKYKSGGNSAEQPYFLHTGQDEQTNSRKEIHSGTSVKLNNSTPWIFKTFNFENAEGKREKQLKKALEKKRITSLTITELIGRWNEQQFRDDILECYKSVSGSLNTNSMVTYSGPEKGTIKVFHNNSWLSRSLEWRNLCRYVFVNNLAGCMYFGDYEAKGGLKWKQYKDSFKSLISLLHVQQVPHHGAASNYNVQLNKPPKLNFISAGISNTYRHPSLWTLYVLNSYRVPWIWISEDSERVVFEYDVSES